MVLRDAIAALAEYFTAKWLWISIFFGLSIFASFTLSMLIGFIGLVIPYSWVFIWLLLDELRKRRLKPVSEWETKRDVAELVKEYVELQRQLKAKRAN